MLRTRKLGSVYAVCPSDVEAGLSSTESSVGMRGDPRKPEKKPATHFLTDCWRRFFCNKPNVSDSDDEEILYTSTPQVK